MCVLLTDIMLKNYHAVELLFLLTFKSVYKHAWLKAPCESSVSVYCNWFRLLRLSFTDRLC
jgi:hypothetical protein